MYIVTALWVVIVILILIIIGAGLWYYWKQQKAKGGESDPGELDMAPIAPDSPDGDEEMYDNPEGNQFDVTTAPRDGMWTGHKPNKPVPIPPKKKGDEEDRDDEKVAMTQNGYDNQGRQRILSDEAQSDEENIVSPGSPGQMQNNIISNDNDDEYEHGIDSMMVHKISVVEMEDTAAYQNEIEQDPIDDIDVLSDGDIVGDVNSTMTGE